MSEFTTCRTFSELEKELLKYSSTRHGYHGSINGATRFKITPDDIAVEVKKLKLLEIINDTSIVKIEITCDFYGPQVPTKIEYRHE